MSDPGNTLEATTEKLRERAERFHTLTVVVVAVMFVVGAGGAIVGTLAYLRLGDALAQNRRLGECIVSLLNVLPEQRTLELEFALCPDVKNIRTLAGQAPVSTTPGTTTSTSTPSTAPAAPTTRVRTTRPAPRTSVATRPPATPATNPPATRPPRTTTTTRPCATPTVPPSVPLLPTCRQPKG